MIREVHEEDDIRPLIGRKIRQADNARIPSLMRQEGEEIGDFNRIIQGHRLHVRLADQHHRGSVLGMEMPLHRREFDGLIFVHLLCNQITRGHCRHDAGNETDHDGQRKTLARDSNVIIAKQVNSSQGRPSENWL